MLQSKTDYALEFIIITIARIGIFLESRIRMMNLHEEFFKIFEDGNRRVSEMYGKQRS